MAHACTLAVEAMLTMRPPPAARIRRAPSCPHRKTARTLTAKTSSKTSTGVSMNETSGEMPATHTSTSGAAPPNHSSTAAKAEAICSGCAEIAGEVAKALAAQLRGLAAVAQVDPGHGRALGAEHRGHALADAAGRARDHDLGAAETVVRHTSSSRASSTQALGCQCRPISLPSGSSTA